MNFKENIFIWKNAPGYLADAIKLKNKIPNDLQIIIERDKIKIINKNQYKQNLLLKLKGGKK